MTRADHSADSSTRAVQSTLWAYLAFFLGRALTFVSTIILARLLVPEQFGLVGYCVTAIQYFDMLNTFGVDSALISRRDKVEEAANAALIISLVTSLLMFGAAWILAPAIARFFNEEAVTGPFRVLAVVLPISALGTVPGGLIQRGLRFKAKLMPELGRSVLKGLLSILLAWKGFGVWSLIWGQLGGELVAALSSWWLAHWRPTLKFDSQVTREVLRYGGHIILIGLAGALLVNVDYLLVGRLLGTAALGYYMLAYRVPELMIRTLNSVVGRVAHPVLAQLQSDVQQMRTAYLSYLRYISLFTFPAGVGLAFVAAPFIVTFYTSKWASAIPAMQMIALALAVSSIGFMPGVLYKAMNRPEILNHLALLKVPFAVGVLWYGTRWGITGVALGQIAVAIFNVTLDSVMVNRVVKVQFMEMLKAILPALMGTTGMGLAVMIAAALLASNGIISLVLLIVVGMGAHLGTLMLVSRETVVRAGAVLHAMLVRA